MEVDFKPEVQAKLEEMTRETWCPPAEVIENAVLGLYDELAHTREMLYGPHHEMESGKVEGIDGEEAYRRLMENTQAQRQCRPARVATFSTRKHSTISTNFAATLLRTTRTRPTAL